MKTLFAHLTFAAVALLSFTFLSPHSYAQCNPCLSAGVKIGHTFGDGGGFTWGVEASYTQWSSTNTIAPVKGLVVAFDRNSASDGDKLHFGFEGGGVVSVFSAGLDLGPTLIFSGDNPVELGFTFTPYIGAFTAFPYYSLTAKSSGLLEEAGVLGKFPVVMDRINL